MRRSESPTTELIRRITDQRQRFLNFLSARVEDYATAEDILQGAYVKAIERGAEIREQESAVAWFYRILRNAVTDHYRRRGFRAKALETLSSENLESYQHEIKGAACECIEDVIRDLKPEYRKAIEQVDLGEIPVERFAQSEEISANNASVRLHRARKAVATQLKTVCGSCAEHQCLDCTCRHGQV